MLNKRLRDQLRVEPGATVYVGRLAISPEQEDLHLCYVRTVDHDNDEAAVYVDPSLLNARIGVGADGSKTFLWTRRGVKAEVDVRRCTFEGRLPLRAVGVTGGIARALGITYGDLVALGGQAGLAEVKTF